MRFPGVVVLREMNELTGLLERLLFVVVVNKWTMLMYGMPFMR
jgi:hypothetical protein